MPKHPDSRLTFQQDDVGDATISYAPTPGSTFVPSEVHIQRDHAAWLWPILKAYAEGQDILPDAGDAELQAEMDTPSYVPVPAPSLKEKLRQRQADRDTQAWAAACREDKPKPQLP